MVRVKAKKQKGDDAFTKRKQKVGRKKLAPATATRAEIHARTLRLNSSSVLSRASEALRSEGKLSSAQTKHLEKHKSNAHDSKMAAMITIMHTFSELMANTHHYKASQRASAFASLQRLLQEQAMIDANKSTVSGAARMAVHQTLFYEQEKKYGSASANGGSSGHSSKSNVITPLEQLRGFAAALEALTDTEAEVRIAALRAIDTFLLYEWETSRHTATHIMEEEYEEEYKQQQHNNKENKSYEINMKCLFSQQNNTEVDAKSIVDGVVLEQVVAIVQMAYITLTHALRGVRMSAIELLSILVKHVPSTLLIREAFFRVYAQQQIHTTASMNTTSFPLTEHANRIDLVNGNNSSSNDTHTIKSAIVPESRCDRNNIIDSNQHNYKCKNDVNSASNSIEDAEVERDKWICSLLSRVSALVLRSEYVHLLLSLLRLFFSSSSFHKHHHHHHHLQAQNLSTMSYNSQEQSDQESVIPNSALRHPEIVAEFLLQDVLPKWTSAWKEVMELQVSLLRQRDKLEQAICLAECFGVMLTYLKEHEVYSRQCRYNNVLLPHNNKGHLTHIHGIDSTRTKQARAFIFFNRTQLEFFQHVLLIKVPITMKELLEKRNDNVIDSNLRARFAMALANICVPLANTDEGWKLLQQYFVATLASVKNESQSKKGDILVHLTSKKNCQEVAHMNRNKLPSQQQQQLYTITTTLINFIDICLRLVYMYKLTNSTLATISTSKPNKLSATTSSTPLNHIEIIYKINNKVVQLLPSLIDAIMCIIDAEITSLTKSEQTNQKCNSNTTICNINHLELHLLFKSMIMLLTYCTTLPVPFYLESTGIGVAHKGKAGKEESNKNDKEQKCTKAGISLLYTLSQIPRLLFGLGQLASSLSSLLSSSEQQYSMNSGNQKNDDNIDSGYINAYQQEAEGNNYKNYKNNITINSQHEKLDKSKVGANISNNFNNNYYNNSNEYKINIGHAKIANTPNLESDLMNYTNFVDDMVFSLLELLWSLVSSGHCLMFVQYTEMLHLLHNNRKEKQVHTSTNNTNSIDDNNSENSKTKTDSSLFDLLQRSVPSLFGMTFDNTVMTGVLVWCNERTVDLARHLLFYLHNSNCDRVVLQKTEYGNNNNNIMQNEAKQNIETSIGNMALLLETILKPED